MYEEENELFYVRVEQGDKVAIVRVEKNESKWIEHLEKGDEIYGIGQKYMSYLKPSDIMEYFKKEFDRAVFVSEEEVDEFDEENWEEEDED